MTWPEGFDNPVIRAAVLMATSCAIFAVMNILIRDLSQELHPLQVVFLRNFFGFAAVCTLIFRDGSKLFQTRRLGTHFIRSIVGLTAMYFWFYSVTYLPQAKAVALSFTMPLFALVGAAFFLGEKIRIRRWTATMVGFIGALIIIRPGFQQINGLEFLPIGAAVFIACALLLVKNLSGTERPNTMIFFMGLWMTPLSLIPALFVWETPGLETLLWSALLGFIAFLAHQCITRAFALAEASIVTPFDYLRLPCTALAAFVFFGEVPEVWVWIGAALIASSACYIAWRESQLARRDSSS